MDLNYTVFDFGASAGRISAARAEVLAANIAFNDTHRNVIYRVEQAYYQILNASGQEEAARANLSNAPAVQEAAEERLSQYRIADEALLVTLVRPARQTVNKTISTQLDRSA